MQRNDVLIDKVISYIREHPEEWDQGGWIDRAKTACGTTACFAGHAMLLSGYEVQEKLQWECDDEQCETCKNVTLIFVRPDGTVVDAEDDEANRLLGLREDEGARIYYRTYVNNVDQLQKIIDGLRAEDMTSRLAS